jgi:hypothetical protein
MAGWDFPAALEVGGEQMEIRTDFRVILDLMEVFADETISDVERANVALSVFYFGVDYGAMPPELQQEAIDKMMWFVRGGKDATDEQPGPRLMDWNQDFHLIVGPINSVLGYECRAVRYDNDTNTGGLHWWTFLSAYTEIGECYFQQVVSIRMQKSKGKRLDKSDQDFYRKHRADIDLKRSMTSEEEALLAKWISDGR